jgi:hypothetical protein
MQLQTLLSPGMAARPRPPVAVSWVFVIPSAHTGISLPILIPKLRAKPGKYVSLEQINSYMVAFAEGLME